MYLLHCIIEEKEYIKKATQYSVLPYEQQLELLEKYKKGDIAALEKLVKTNYKFIISIANKYQHIEGIGLNDLIQEGCIGLIEGLQKFNPALGYKLTTYVINWIRMRINRAICNQSRLIRLPVFISEKISKVFKVYGEYITNHIEEPTTLQLAELTGFSAETIAVILHYKDSAVSFETTISEDDSLTLEAFITKEPQVLEPKFDFDKLSYLQANVIKLRYGFTDGQTYSHNQIAKTMNLDVKTIKLLEVEALQQLREQALVISY